MSEGVEDAARQRSIHWQRFMQFRLKTLLMGSVVAAIACGLVANWFVLQQIKVSAPAEVETLSVKGYVPSAWEAKIIAALDQPIDLDVEEMPLEQVVEILQEESGLKIQIDQRALDDYGLGSDTPVTCRTIDTNLRKVLTIMLGTVDPDLTWGVWKESFWLTTIDEAEYNMITRVYDVADLVIVGKAGRAYFDFEELIECIHQGVKPDSWDQVGGPGSICEFSSNTVAALVVNQTWRVHEKIERLLADLRRAKHEGLPAEEWRDKATPPRGLFTNGSVVGSITEGTSFPGNWGGDFRNFGGSPAE